MNIAMVGSRSWPEDKRWMIEQVIDALPPDTTIVSGGARGPDSWAELYAGWRRLPLQIFPAQWDLYGKSAGFRRNQDIIRAADLVIAFWDGTSKGTLSSILLAKQAHKPVLELGPEHTLGEVLVLVDQFVHRPLIRVTGV